MPVVGTTSSLKNDHPFAPATRATIHSYWQQRKQPVRVSKSQRHYTTSQFGYCSLQLTVHEAGIAKQK